MKDTDDFRSFFMQIPTVCPTHPVWLLRGENEWTLLKCWCRISVSLDLHCFVLPVWDGLPQSETCFRWDGLQRVSTEEKPGPEPHAGRAGQALTHLGTFTVIIFTSNRFYSLSLFFKFYLNSPPSCRWSQRSTTSLTTLLLLLETLKWWVALLKNTLSHWKNSFQSKAASVEEM